MANEWNSALVFATFLLLFPESLHAKPILQYKGDGNLVASQKESQDQNVLVSMQMN